MDSNQTPEQQIAEYQLQLQAAENEKREILQDFKNFYGLLETIGAMGGGEMTSIPRIVMKVMSNPAQFSGLGEQIEYVNNKYNFSTK